MTIRPVQRRPGSVRLSRELGNGHEKVAAVSSASSSLSTFHPELHFSPSLPPLSPSAALRVLVSILCVSLSSVPICLTLNAAAVSSHPFSLLLVSALILLCILGLFAVVWSTLHSSSSSPPSSASSSSSSSSPPLFFFVFCLFSFTAFIDFLLCVSAHGLHPLTAFYLQNGEQYLSSPHGAAINFWDGTVHLACYLLSLYCMLTSNSYLALSLLWSGSILNSLIVLLSGAVVGYGSEIRWSVVLNLPYVVLPLLMAVRRWEQKDALLLWPTRGGHSALSTVTRAAAVLVIAATIAVHAVRSMAALCHLLSVAATASPPLLPPVASSSFASSLLASYATDVEPMLISPSAFPLLQHLFLLFVSTPFLLLLLWHVVSSPSSPLSSASLYALLLHTGAIAQAHGTFLLQCLFPFTLLPSMTDQAETDWKLLQLGMSSRRAGLLTLVEAGVMLGNVWLCWLLLTAQRREQVAERKGRL